jgi:NADH-quinone oxidoreductase subunit F
MAAPGALSDAPPTLANNVETLANVPGILAQGAEWFRSVGTDDSPGTIVCTVSGQTPRHGVAEVAMGTPLRDVIDAVGGGALPERRHVAAMSGVANSLILADDFDAGELRGDAGDRHGLGTGGFILSMTRPTSSPRRRRVPLSGRRVGGQCVPCNKDGLELSAILERMCKDTANDADLAELDKRIGTVADSAAAISPCSTSSSWETSGNCSPTKPASTPTPTRDRRARADRGHRRHRGWPSRAG